MLLSITLLRYRRTWTNTNGRAPLAEAAGQVHPASSSLEVRTGAYAAVAMPHAARSGARHPDQKTATEALMRTLCYDVAASALTPPLLRSPRRCQRLGDLLLSEGPIRCGLAADSAWLERHSASVIATAVGGCAGDSRAAAAHTDQSSAQTGCCVAAGGKHRWGNGVVVRPRKASDGSDRGCRYPLPSTPL
jgi:hypothetical protein